MITIKSTGPSAIRAAVRVLKRGGVIAFPTETTYGLGCDPRNANAVARIFKIKGRDKSKPLLLVASSVADAKKAAQFDQPSLTVGMRHWPGPLTLVVCAKKSARLVRGVIPKGEVAVRVSSSRFVQQLVKAYGFPIIATSANKSGEPDCRSGRAVMETFMGQKNCPDVIIDAGALPRRKPSTVVRVHADGSVDVLRQGAARLSTHIS